MFDTMVVIGSTRLTDTSRQVLATLAHRVAYEPLVPHSDDALIRCVGDADALLVAMQVQVTGAVIAACPKLRYIGMLNSLYGPESANVDILAAQARGITVTGLHDYGDEGVVEYVISELVQLLHGFHAHMWRPEPTELTGLACGIIGMGTLGSRITKALRFFGAEVAYFSRTRKPEVEATGVPYRPLDDLLASVDICVCCLNKNVILLHEEQFRRFGEGKILVNIAIGPCSDSGALAHWLSSSANWFLCDTPAPLGDEALLHLPNVLCAQRGAGASVQMTRRYNERVLENIQTFLREHTACASD